MLPDEVPDSLQACHELLHEQAKQLDQPNASKRMPGLLWTIIAIILAFIDGGIWGFGTVYIGMPTIVVSVGALVIAAIIFVWMMGDNSKLDTAA